MSKVGDNVKWQEPGGAWLTGKLLATKGQNQHATAKVRLNSGGTVHVQLVKIRPA